MSKSLNAIKVYKNGSQVILDPSFLIRHAVYLSNGEEIVMPGITLGQVIEFIALAQLKARKPELADKCNAAKIEFKDGKFIVSFADTVDNLSFGCRKDPA